MKKRISFLLILIALLTVFTLSCSLADGSSVYGHTEGYQATLEDGNPITIITGTDASSDDPAIIVYIMYQNGDVSRYGIFTKQTNVLDALLDAGLVEAEKVSWGYSVTTVDTVNAPSDGAWWAYYYVKTVDGQLQTEAIQTGLETISVDEPYAYLFMYMK